MSQARKKSLPAIFLLAVLLILSFKHLYRIRYGVHNKPTLKTLHKKLLLPFIDSNFKLKSGKQGVTFYSRYKWLYPFCQ
jgi:hypothetical protein